MKNDPIDNAPPGSRAGAANRRPDKIKSWKRVRRQKIKRAPT
jgi:hypothetical protein